MGSYDDTRIIMAMSKSAWPEGRVGKREEQDWFLVVEEARNRLLEYRKSGVKAVVIAVTGMKPSASTQPEIYFYKEALLSLGLVEGKDFSLISTGIDTITQLHEAFGFVNLWHGAQLEIVCTKLHFFRTIWLCFWDKKLLNGNTKVMCYTPKKFGKPRSEEIINDLVMMLAIPIIDILGLRKNFLNYVNKRRSSGKL